MHCRVSVPVTLVAALLLSACGASGNKSDVKPSPSVSAPVALYEGAEIKDTPCGPKGDAGAVIDYKTSIRVRTGGLKGELGMRMSTLAGGCNNFFWGRFKPSPGNAKEYTVSIENFSKKVVYKQDSAPNPAIDALTRGTHADVQTSLRVCVRARGMAQVKRDCITATVK